MLLQNLFSRSLIFLWSPPFAKVPISQSACLFCEDAAVHTDALSCTFFLALVFLPLGPSLSFRSSQPLFKQVQL